MRTMYDSVNARDIPTTAQIVAGYDTGRFAWSKADWARFPHAVHVHIATQASYNTGHVLDVEPGDATPSEAPGWVRRRRVAGVDPTIYCSLSNWEQVRGEFRRQGVAEPHYWIARYDGRAVLPAGAVAKQYADPGTHGKGHFDLSVVADHWPGVDGDDDVDEATIKKIARECAVEVHNRTVVDLVTGKQLQARYVWADAARLGAVAAAKEAGNVDELAAALTPKLSAAMLPQLQAAIERVADAGAQITADAVVAELAKDLSAASAKASVDVPTKGEPV